MYELPEVPPWVFVTTQLVFLNDLSVLQLDERGVRVAVAVVLGENSKGLLCSVVMD